MWQSNWYWTGSRGQGEVQKVLCSLSLVSLLWANLPWQRCCGWGPRGNRGRATMLTVSHVAKFIVAVVVHCDAQWFSGETMLTVPHVYVALRLYCTKWTWQHWLYIPHVAKFICCDCDCGAMSVMLATCSVYCHIICILVYCQIIGILVYRHIIYISLLPVCFQFLPISSTGGFANCDTIKY